jgi:hypothetical protein
MQHAVNGRRDRGALNYGMLLRWPESKEQPEPPDVSLLNRHYGQVFRRSLSGRDQYLQVNLQILQFRRQIAALVPNGLNGEHE